MSPDLLSRGRVSPRVLKLEAIASSRGGKFISYDGRKDAEHVSCAEAQETQLTMLRARQKMLQGELAQLDIDIAILELESEKKP